MTRPLALSLILILSSMAPLLGDGLIPPMTPAQVEETRRILAGFKTNPKGPYERIRWFCNDGSEHPPSPPPCADRGGGRQHAVLGLQASKLAQWNVDIGTILAGVPYDQLVDERRDHHRLKQWVLERYLEAVDQGWIYRLAYGYRGARQIEDEEKAGRQVLTKLFSDPEWLGRRYFLASQLVQVIPHGVPTGQVQKIRTLAKSIADLDPRFQSLRSKIHSTPDASDLRLVQRFLRERRQLEPSRPLLLELVDALKHQESEHALKTRVPAIRGRLAGTPLATLWDKFSAALSIADGEEVYRQGSALSFAIFQAVVTSNNGARNLELMDLNTLIQDEGFRVSASLAAPTRRAAFRRLLDSFLYAVGSGLISLRQLDFLRKELEPMLDTDTLEPETYYRKVRYLARSTEWCRATVSREFSPVIQHYQPAVPEAASFLDHLLRSSMALPLSHRLEKLVDDANRRVGLRHVVLGDHSSLGVVGLNPGVAIGPLSVIEGSSPAAAQIHPSGIYVIPQTISDLKPMAGILSLDSGNALSHTQILAANLGIPNATVPSSLLPLLREWDSREVFFAVSPRGSVVVRGKNEMSAEALSLWTRRLPQRRPRAQLEGSRLDLDTKALLSFRELNLSDSGVRVGPKAANLAQLARLFPHRVAEGFVIPFGVFAEHIRSVKNSAGQSIESRIRKTFQETERLKEAGSTLEARKTAVYPKLREIRRSIEEMPLLATFEGQLIAKMPEVFGSRWNATGVFIRSDTNVEDLPGFTGAGLNLTRPNQVGLASIKKAIKQVWASPFTERAFEWRSRALQQVQGIYPSVIVMRAVAAEKSGVLATVDLETGSQNEITVNVSEGISAVVDGGVAESLLLGPSGEVKLLHQARASYRKVLGTSGGLQNLPPLATDTLLTQEDIKQIREIAARVKAVYPVVRSAEGQPLPWDIEFGIEKGRLQLFQIRPLARFQEIKTLQELTRLDNQPPPKSLVRLDGALQ